MMNTLPRLWRQRAVLFLVTVAAFATPVLASPDVVGETRATVVLHGGGKLPAGIRERFVELAGGKKANIVVLSAAATPPDAEKLLAPWKDLGVASAALLYTREKEKAGDADFLKPLTEATGVWLDEGDPIAFAETYLQAPVEKALTKILAGGGVVGTGSAMANLAGPIWYTGTLAKPETHKGFGWLPYTLVEPHFLKRNRVDRLHNLLATQKPGKLGLGIDEGTAVVLRGRTLQVLGESYVSLCLASSARRPASTQTMAAGGVADLVALQKAALARAEHPLFPPDKPAMPEVAKGTLIIGGGGGMPLGAWKKFIDLAGGPDAVIVVIPTALEDNQVVDPGEAKALRLFGAKNVKVLHTRSRKEADTEEFAAPLRKAGGVWFTGGRQWKFVDSYEGTLTERLCHEVLKRGGVIGGSSAGASIQSEYMPRGHPLGNLVMMAEGYERGFGFLPGVAVDQHFFARKRTGDMSDVMRMYPQLLGIGIDEGTILIVTGSVFEVVGKSKVAVFDRKKPIGEDGKDYEELPTGSRYDMKTRKRLE
jgi:cyanophycinase